MPTRRQYLAGVGAAFAGEETLRELLFKGDGWLGNTIWDPVSGAANAVADGTGELWEDFTEPNFDMSVDDLGEFNGKAGKVVGETSKRSWSEAYLEGEDIRFEGDVFEVEHELEGDKLEVEPGDTYNSGKYGVFSATEENIDNIEDGGVHFENDQGEWVAISDITVEIPGVGDTEGTENAFLALRDDENFNPTELEEIADMYDLAAREAGALAGKVQELGSNGQSLVRNAKEYVDEDEMEDYRRALDYLGMSKNNRLRDLSEELQALLDRSQHYKAAENLFRQTARNENIAEDRTETESPTRTDTATETPEETPESDYRQIFTSNNCDGMAPGEMESAVGYLEDTAGANGYSPGDLGTEITENGALKVYTPDGEKIFNDSSSIIFNCRE